MRKIHDHYYLLIPPPPHPTHLPRHRQIKALLYPRKHESCHSPTHPTCCSIKVSGSYKKLTDQVSYNSRSLVIETIRFYLCEFMQIRLLQTLYMYKKNELKPALSSYVFFSTITIILQHPMLSRRQHSIVDIFKYILYASIFYIKYM